MRLGEAAKEREERRSRNPAQPTGRPAGHSAPAFRRGRRNSHRPSPDVCPFLQNHLTTCPPHHDKTYCKKRFAS